MICLKNCAHTHTYTHRYKLTGRLVDMELQNGLIFYVSLVFAFWPKKHNHPKDIIKTTYFMR